jgi:superoxide dismutase, Fe-Mn family
MKNKNELLNEIKVAIDTSLGGVLEEAYVAEPKKFDLRTDAISDKTKKYRLDEFEQIVETLNRVSAELDGADRSIANDKSSDFRRLKLDEAHLMNASFLRAMHFENIADMSSNLTMDTLSYIRLARDFGSFEDWQNEFIACCLSSRDGYGVTGYSVFLKRFVNLVIDTESLNVPIGVYPVIVLDVAEGAYYRDYGNDRRSYVFAMMKEFDWNKIESRFDRTDKLAKVFK